MRRAFFMKYSVLCMALLCALSASAHAGVILNTSNDPLVQTAGALDMTTNPSASMYVNVQSNNFPNDVMAFWLVNLQIAPITGSGTLTFQNPSGSTAPNPPNYIFGNGALANNIGIGVTNLGTALSANDFYFDSSSLTSGAVVPGATPKTLLQLNFSATAGTSGSFGIYAVPGGPVDNPQNPALTYWTDSNTGDQDFSNIPGGPTALSVLIGEVDVNLSITTPEPSTLALSLLGSTLMIGCYRRRRGRASQNAVAA
jgi:hypothetical protein